MWFILYNANLYFQWKNKVNNVTILFLANVCLFEQN